MKTETETKQNKCKMKKKAKTKTKAKMKTIAKIKPKTNKKKTKGKWNEKQKLKTKWKQKKKRIKTKGFCFFLKPVWSRGAIGSQLSLTWPRSVTEFSCANFARGLLVPYMVYSLLKGHFRVEGHFS